MGQTKYSRLYDFVRSRQLENTYDLGSEIGVWPITSNRIDYGWGKIPEENWPYQNHAEWPPKEPAGLDLIAKQHRGPCYQRIRSVYEGKLALFRYLGFFAAFEITEQWFSAKEGIIADSDQVSVASHCVSIEGYDDSLNSFRFVNSWGEDWGEKGYGRLSYTYFQNHLVEAWTLIGLPSLTHLVETHNHEGITVRKYVIDSPLEYPVRLIETIDSKLDEKIGWCIAIPREGWIDVEELFVRPLYRNKGHGRTLSIELLKLAVQMKLPLRLWIPHSDVESDNFDILTLVIENLGLKLESSDVRWASFKAESEIYQENDACIETQLKPTALKPSSPWLSTKSNKQPE